MSQDRPPLASGALDRDAETRMDDELLRAAWRDARARVVRLRGPEALVEVAEDGGIRLALEETRGDALPAFEPGRPGACYLGRLRGAPVFALPGDEDSARPASAAHWRHVFEVGAELGTDDRELVSVASALLRWHENAEFSPRDGERTTVVQGGWARVDAHGGEHFPRTDPAVIVLVEHCDRVLLGSNALWPAGRFSLLAGFVEAGESLERTVEREVFEEAGVRLSGIRYVTSQPWPFPRSLMLGFRAGLAEGQDPEDLRPDMSEISELRWFTRDELRDPPPGITLPGGLSVARWLLDRWIEEEPVEEGGGASECDSGASDLGASGGEDPRGRGRLR